MFCKLKCLLLCLAFQGLDFRNTQPNILAKMFMDSMDTMEKFVENEHKITHELEQSLEDKVDHRLEKDVGLLESRVASYVGKPLGGLIQDTLANHNNEDQHKGIEKRSAYIPGFFPNLPAAWSTIYHSFPPTVHDVMKNAEVRYAAEVQGVTPIEYNDESPGYNGDQYTTSFKESFVPNLKTKRSSDSVQTFSPTSANQILGKVGSPFTEVVTDGRTRRSAAEYDMFGSVKDERGRTRRAAAEHDMFGSVKVERPRSPEVQTYDPTSSRFILEKEPLGAPFTKVNNANHRSRRSPKNVQTYDPTSSRFILDKEPIGAHFTEVKTNHRSRRSPVEVQTYDPTSSRLILDKEPIGAPFTQVKANHRSRRSPKEVQTFDPTFSREILGKEPFGSPYTKVETNQRARRSPLEAQTFDPSQASKILGTGPLGSTHASRIRRFAKSLEVARTTGQTPEELREAEKAIGDIDLATSIIENSSSPEEAIKAMQETEDALDSALHQVLGDKHLTDEKDVEMMEKMMSSLNHHLDGDQLDQPLSEEKEVELMEKMLSSLHNHQVERRSTDGPTDVDVEEIFRSSVQNMAKVNDILEKDGNSEKALETIMTGEKMLDTMIETLLSPVEVEKITHARRKRSHGVGYYDPEFQWLAKELDIPSHELESLRKIAEKQEEYREPYNRYGESPVRKHPKDIYTHQQNGDYTKAQYQRAQAYDLKPTYSQGEPKQYSKPYPFPIPSRSLQTTYQQKPLQPQSTLQRLIAQLKPMRKVIPTEVEAAYHGAVEVGKHWGSRLQPYYQSGYNTVAYNYIPKARKSFNYAINSVPRDIKDFAQQGKKIVDTRARYVSEAAQPNLERLQDDLWLLQQQLKTVAKETKDYTNSQVVPSVVPTLRGLVHDIQETLELASEIVEQDVKPLAGTVNTEFIQPTYDQVKSGWVYPAARTVNDYLLRPASDYLAGPLAQSKKYSAEAVDKYAVPAYLYASGYAKSAASGLSSAADSSAVVYQNKVKPTFKELAAEYKKVMTDKVNPALEETANEVADRAARIGGTFQSEVVPPLKEGLKTTLNGVFTGIPSLVQKLSYEAHDAAKVFTGKYSESLKEMQMQEEKVQREEDNLKNKVRQLLETATEPYKGTIEDDATEATVEDAEASIEDVEAKLEEAEASPKDSEAQADNQASENNSAENEDTEDGGETVEDGGETIEDGDVKGNKVGKPTRPPTTLRPKVTYKTSTEL